MDKDYLIEEVIASLDELQPFSDAFVIQSVNDDDYGMIKLLKEAEMIVEHLASCIIALKKGDLVSTVKKFTNLGDHLPIWHFDENLMVYNDGSLGGGLKINGLDISTATHEVVNQFCQQITNLLNSMEEGLRLQLFYRLSSNVSDLIESHAKEMLETDEAYRPLVDARINFLKKNEEAGNFYSPEIVLFLRGRPQNIKRDSLFKPNEHFSQMIEDEYGEHRDQFLRAFEQVKDHLDGLG